MNFFDLLPEPPHGQLQHQEFAIRIAVHELGAGVAAFGHTGSFWEETAGVTVSGAVKGNNLEQAGANNSLRST
jgi:hypothetical protein